MQQSQSSPPITAPERHQRSEKDRSETGDALNIGAGAMSSMDMSIPINENYSSIPICADIFVANCLKSLFAS